MSMRASAPCGRLPAMRTLILIVALALFTPVLASAAPPPEEAKVKAPEPIDVKNDLCPVSGDEKAKSDVFVDYEGLRVHFCCPPCKEKFLKDPKKYLKAMGIEDVEKYKKDKAGAK